MQIPVISSHVLRGLPAFLRHELGEGALQRANRAAGFDVELVEDRNFFVPQQSVLAFLDCMARTLGNRECGLALVPALDVAAYGAFGRYVTEADSLALAIRRGFAALRFHSTGDQLAVTATSDELRLSYRFALNNLPGYHTVACIAAGELVSFFRAYLSDNWRPLRVELDIPRPPRPADFEDVFQCPVLFHAPSLGVVVERHHLSAPARRRPARVLTLDDVSRDRGGGAPGRLFDITVAQIRVQLLTGHVSIDDVARSMGTSIRTLQRELNQAGTDFRNLTGAVRLQRAAELLRDRTVSISDISEDLGYASPTGFSRAFRKATGVGPRAYRAQQIAVPLDI